MILVTIHCDVSTMRDWEWLVWNYCNDFNKQWSTQESLDVLLACGYGCRYSLELDIQGHDASCLHFLRIVCEWLWRVDQEIFRRPCLVRGPFLTVRPITQKKVKHNRRMPRPARKSIVIGRLRTLDGSGSKVTVIYEALRLLFFTVVLVSDTTLRPTVNLRLRSCAVAASQHSDSLSE